jgi:hypothetical protein
VSINWLRLLVVLGWISVTVTAVDYLRLEEEFRRMRFESARIEASRAPETTRPPLVLTQVASLIRFARTEARPDMTARELTDMAQVAHRYPLPPTLFRYALALGLNHRYEEASLELKRLERFHIRAHHDEIRNNWATLTEQYPTLANVPAPGSP